jgi:hypothetical protein
MKDYNRLALQGIKFSDNDFGETFNLDPEILNTPKINDAMLDLMYDKNVKGFMEEGMPEGKAKAEAGRLRAETRKEIEALY